MIVKNSEFKQLVLQIVRDIPIGQIMTYGQVASLAGRPKAARAVGMIMSKNLDSQVPCHRVIRSDGKLGGYNRGEARKLELLRQEGAIK